MPITGEKVRSLNTVELLGVTSDKNITFKVHVENICCKVSNKIRALFRVRNFQTLERVKVLAEACMLSNFRHCLII